MPLLLKNPDGRFSRIKFQMIIFSCNMLKILKKQSDLGLRCLSIPIRQTTSVCNFRTSTVCHNIVILIFHKKINDIF